jgi:uncharacterized protein
MIEDKTKADILTLLKTCQIRALCDNFFSDEFLWVIKGTSVLSGTYENKEDFFNLGMARLNRALKGDWILHIINTFIDNDTMIVEMRGEVKTINDNDYNNDYCWIFQFEDNKVVKLTAYYDSLLVNKTLAEAESAG